MCYSFSFKKLVLIEGGCFFGYTWRLFSTSRCVQGKVGRKKRKAVVFGEKVVSFLLKVGKGWPRSVPPSTKSEPRCARRGELARQQKRRPANRGGFAGRLSIGERRSERCGQSCSCIRLFLQYSVFFSTGALCTGVAGLCSLDEEEWCEVPVGAAVVFAPSFGVADFWEFSLPVV